MGISVEEIRNSNKEFYYGNYFSRSKRERGFWIIFSLFIVVLLQIVTYCISYGFIQRCYINEARFEDLGTEEIYDWAGRQMGIVPKELVIILIAGGVIIAYTIILYCMDVISIYKYKRRCLIITIIIFGAELIGIAFFNWEILSNNISIFVLMGLLYFLKLIFELLNAGIILPVEMKAPAGKIFINIVNKVIDKVLKGL